MVLLDGERRAELVGSLGAVRARIADACLAAGRDPHSVTLIAVTKTYPARDVATLAALGVLDIGESRDQEASAKLVDVAELRGAGADQRPVADLRWHFVGRLQSRKARSVAAYAHAVHSVDRPELVEQLAAGVTRAGRDGLEVFIQVSLDGDPARGGVPPDGVQALADAVAAHGELRLLGVMAVAPMAADAGAAFADLAAVSVQLRADHPQAAAISAGMSADLEAAIAHGSTHVRVGSALLGRRSDIFS
ncbi:MAG: YggS family pyridoxal phosphate-dependent enzyme [Actinomycetota bacterium]|nr:YggS family pyridoxal phosphate-dependent enzyme [Actinomycetota bacterium]